MKAELEECRGYNSKVHGAPSLIVSQEPAMMTTRGVAPFCVREGKLYSEALGSKKKLTKFKLTV